MNSLKLLQLNDIHLYVQISPIQFSSSLDFTSKLQLFVSSSFPWAFMQVTFLVLVPFPQYEEHWMFNRKIKCINLAMDYLLYYFTPWSFMPVIIAVMMVTCFMWSWLFLKALYCILCNWITQCINCLYTCNISVSVATSTTFWTWWPIGDIPSTNKACIVSVTGLWLLHWIYKVSATINCTLHS